MFNPILPVRDDDSIPDDATCQEASVLSVHNYIPCGDTAVAIVYHPKDGRKYYMCAAYTDHNVRHRGGKLIARKS
jgi:hypothetical protein